MVFDLPFVEISLCSFASWLILFRKPTALPAGCAGMVVSLCFPLPFFFLHVLLVHAACVLTFVGLSTCVKVNFSLRCMLRAVYNIFVLLTCWLSGLPCKIFYSPIQILVGNLFKKNLYLCYQEEDFLVPIPFWYTHFKVQSTVWFRQVVLVPFQCFNLKPKSYACYAMNLVSATVMYV